MIKKIFTTFILMVLLAFPATAAGCPSVSAHRFILIDADTGAVICEKEADTVCSMASTTKIMTALLAVESGKLDCVVTAGKLLTEGTSIGLKPGYQLTVEALVYGMLLESGNDAALLTANFLAGSEENFAVMMNERAHELGMTSTNFVTASGLDSPDHYTTATDMAKLAAAAIKNETFREICSSKTKTVDYIEPGIKVTFSNHNRLLRSCEGVFGIKTGFTKKSGRCLVSACEREGITLIAVTLNAPDDWNDHSKLYDYGYSLAKHEEYVPRIPKSVTVVGGCGNSVALRTSPDRITLDYIGSDSKTIQRVFLPKFLYAPIKKGEVVGRVQFLRGENLLAEVPIISAGNIEALAEEERGFFSRLWDKIKDIFR
ncbi:MAG: D-alanyl-D-alanine carboxypeptidase [Oscillospiraceae bacterium]|nr:D-alanyl-D-alanine carboxypeptidase [Oscillospiraceae bacterium]